MCSFDDKRYLLADGIHTLAFGHKSIPATIRTAEEDGHVKPKVITAAQSRSRKIPFEKRKFPQCGELLIAPDSAASAIPSDSDESRSRDEVHKFLFG